MGEMHSSCMKNSLVGEGSALRWSNISGSSLVRLLHCSLTSVEGVIWW